MEITIVGDIGIDFYKNLNLTKPGGIAFNLAYYLKKIGVEKVSLISVLGNDQNSKKLLKLLKKSNINSTYIQIRKGNLPKQNIFLKNGERKFTGYDPGVLKKWKLRKIDLEFTKKQDAVFVPLSDGMEQIFTEMKKISGPIKIVDFSQDYEFADFDKQDNVITKNSRYFDIIFVGGMKKHEKMIEQLSQKLPEKVFVLTFGKNGSLAFYKNKKYIQLAIKTKVADTTGCGDAFQAGFLATWLKTTNIKKSLKKGTTLAAITIKNIGSTPHILS